MQLRSLIAALLAAMLLAPHAAAAPVLVELFTSEGCSSCPPADELLSELARRQPVEGAEIIPLSFHVDYFNSAAWRDPYSDRDYTRRQVTYARALPNLSPYTPQMIVNGRQAFLGSDRGRAERTIAAAARGATMRVNVAVAEGASGGRLSLAVETAGLPEDSRRGDVWLAVTEDNLTSEVAGGENDGRTLRHDAVVRWMGRAGKIDAQDDGFTARVPFRPREGWRTTNMAVVAFVQDGATMQILGADAAPLEGSAETPTQAIRRK